MNLQNNRIKVLRNFWRRKVLPDLRFARRVSKLILEKNITCNVFGNVPCVPRSALPPLTFTRFEPFVPKKREIIRINKESKLKIVRPFWKRNSYRSLLQAIAQRYSLPVFHKEFPDIEWISDELRLYNIQKEYKINLHKKEIAQISLDQCIHHTKIKKISFLWTNIESTYYIFLLHQEYKDGSFENLNIGCWFWWNKTNHVMFELVKKMLRKMSVK